MIKAVMIAAVDWDMCLGRADGSLAHRIPEDLARFKELTMGHAVVMGRKTVESLPKKGLPDRAIFGITHDLSQRLPWGPSWSSTPAIALIKAIEWAVLNGHDKVFVCGGASIYKALAPVCDEAIITRIDREPPEDCGAHLDIEPWRSDFVSGGNKTIAPGVAVRHGRRRVPRPTCPGALLRDLTESLQKVCDDPRDAIRLAHRWVVACEELSRRKGDASLMEAFEALLDDVDTPRGSSA